MSLIGEALKKAHLEAIRQDGSSAGLAHTPGVAQYRQRPSAGRTGWSAALVISNVVLALIVATVVIWRWNERTPRDPVPAISTESAGAPTSTEAPSSPVAATAADTATSSPATAPSRAESAEPRPVAAAAAAAVSPSEPVVEAVAPPPVKPAPAPAPRAVDGLVAGQTYMRSVPVPGGQDLVLNGMSVSGGVGVALINSRMVRTGDRIGPFTVGSIGDRRVELGYKGITIYLKMP